MKLSRTIQPTLAMQRAMQRTPMEEFHRLRLAVRRLDVQVVDLRLQAQAGRKVTHKLIPLCELRAQAMQKLAQLGGLMNAYEH